ncbi:class I SAM-dependent methyltransferase [Nonlabens ulvanivorans]|uniref:2-polyprenyl-3-methyl-5-hydroxy-6-metoxy-1, 4-benzoquinol methylase n=1 Tax=Nonlabens ulvanivorans TaxID=906888 RepID=A0A084JU05_NONUL|nr:class I SAM-dependent methyltransferase [Nonlabens ulvanivorans]KEZ92439.1 methyltransferase [Nonlabens ulvanivorans]PRX15275.1 2-polyprenyl-3-methyl-5-hydroxy-6-metoxy-1,4-benzoquinol methylase [Nonlabens ulvanivorans]
MKKNNNYSEHFLSLKDYFLTQESFELYKDPSSAVLKTIPQPKHLEAYYESEDYLSHDDSQTSFFAKCYQFAKRWNLKSKKQLIAKYAIDGKILDIGAGVGDVVAILKNAGYDAIGFEPSEKARSFAARKGIELLNQTDSIEPKSIKVISMYHVLEHVPDFEQQINQIQNWLTKDGILILALPNYNSFDAKYFKNEWAGYDVPRHLYHFNKEAIRNIFQDRFELITTKPMWFDSLYVSILSARYQKRKFSFLYGLCIGFLSNCSAVFTKEPSSLVYVLKKRF